MEENKMEQIEDLQQTVEEDLQQGAALLWEYGHDAEQMAALFDKLMLRYHERIDGFSKDLRVVQPYETLLQKSEDYRENVRMLLFRLRAFAQNGCSNEGLVEYYMALEHIEIDPYADFSKVRMTIGMMDSLSRREREEIMEKLNEMEEICAMVMPKQKKWDLLRGYLLWLSGKPVDAALTVLPLFLRIS